MEYLRHQRRKLWDLARRQHGVVAHWQLVEIGMHPQAIKRRVAGGRLHRVRRGVYAVGRPELSIDGEWMAAVLAAGRGAVLSHESAAMILGILPMRRGTIHVSRCSSAAARIEGVCVHRRNRMGPAERGTCRGIPLTSPIRTLIDIAPRLPSRRLEAAVNEADQLDLVHAPALREALAGYGGVPGVRPFRALLDRDTFRLTESELERRFLAIARRAGLPLPDTQTPHGRGRIDFTWSELGLVVETDGWRYHRTPSRQARDNRRMQAHAAAGRTAIRISHREVRYEAERVAGLLGKLIGQAPKGR